MTSLRRRLVTSVLAVVGVLGLAAGCIPPGTTPRGTPPAPFKDAIPTNGNSGDHGWFQAGHAWVGDFGDPDILRIGNTYYAYSASAGGRYLSIETSTDLRTWKIHPNWSKAAGPYVSGWQAGVPQEIIHSGDTPVNQFNNNDALVRPASWGLKTPINNWLTETYWAPSVFNIGSTWYAYSAVKVGTQSDDPHAYGRFCITVASSTTGPMGPFRDISGSGPIQCQPAAHDPSGSIDPYPYHDAANGKDYLLWKAAGKVGVRESALMAVELGSNGKPKAGASPVQLLQTNRKTGWEGGTVENPSMVTYNGTTYLFYSANDSIWNDSSGRSNYATGYAICPRGPLAACNRVAGGVRPLLASSGVSQGPGGASPVIDPTNHLHLAYASYWLGENRNGYHPRRLHVAVLVQNPDKSLRVSSLG